ncbi:MAG: TIGR00266 family protein [Oribacterium sp.]|nr:TIGR00266 family protein [Oribacterium sp.]
MNYKTMGSAANPLIEIYLNTGEKAKIENGAMVYMQDVAIEGKTNSNGKGGLGGLLKAAARAVVSGESMFITEARGTAQDGRIGIAPSIPGVIAKLSVGSAQYRLNTGAFLACDDSVSYNVVSQKDLGKALFGGTGGFFIMETIGTGDMLINAFGDIVELEVTPDKPLSVDNENVIAWDRNLDYQIKVASGTFGFTSGEGLVNEFHGSGKVLIQTRNVHSFADTLTPLLPFKKD